MCCAIQGYSANVAAQQFTPADVGANVPPRLSSVVARRRARKPALFGQGGTSKGEPESRTQYYENFYAAYVQDTGGNKIAAVCRGITHGQQRANFSLVVSVSPRMRLNFNLRVQ
jgi:hypothetical protein